MDNVLLNAYCNLALRDVVVVTKLERSARMVLNRTVHYNNCTIDFSNQDLFVDGSLIQPGSETIDSYRKANKKSMTQPKLTT